MKLIKTFMAAALLSTAFAGSVMAADELGFQKGVELEDAKGLLGLVQNKTLDTLTDLTIDADLPEKFAAVKTEYDEADVKALVANEAKLYRRLVEEAGSLEKFKEIVAKKKPAVKAFEFKPEQEDLGLGDQLKGLLAQFVADPFAALVDSEEAKQIVKLHEGDAVRKQYVHLLAARDNHDVADKEEAAQALKAFLDETVGEKFQVDGKEVNFADYVKAETTPMSMADHRAKVADLKKAHKEELDGKKPAAHEAAGGALIEAFIANASKFSSLKTNNAFKGLGILSFTKTNLRGVDAKVLGEAILGSITELLKSATEKDLQIVDLQRQLEAASNQKPATSSGSVISPAFQGQGDQTEDRSRKPTKVDQKKMELDEGKKISVNHDDFVYEE